MLKSIYYNTFFILCLLIISLQAQAELPVSIHGSFQSDVLFPQEDEAINTGSYDEFALTNTYLDLNLLSKHLEAGGRFEFLKYPLPGFEDDFGGWGIPFFYATGKLKSLKLTVGDFYEQFGNGLIFRTYQERSLGIDNAMRGGRLVFEPFKGVNIKALGGKQRRYFSYNDSFIWGADTELNIEQWNKFLKERNVYWLVGGSFVSKYEKAEDIALVGLDKKLNLPENVGAFDVRTRIQTGSFNFLAEYAWKANDPSYDNGYIYKSGNALLLSGSYFKSGLSVLLQAKRNDNMSFRSKRSMTLSSSFINHLPAFTKQQTYSLATIYPYSTQIAGDFQGEWAFQGELSYLFKRKTLLGGKYGTHAKLNASYIRSIDKQPVESLAGAIDADKFKGTNGYTSKFFKFGEETFYKDVTLTIEKKLTSDFSFNFMYQHQYFNQFVVQGHGEIVNANIFVEECKYKINKKLTLRTELQYLQTRQDEGDWLAALAELSIAPSFSFTVSDMYNAGTSGLHYYMASGVFNYNAHRLQLGYGRTRAGYNCSGGICRFVPASKGFQLSYNYQF